MNVFEQLNKSKLFEICCRLGFYLAAFYSISHTKNIIMIVFRWWNSSRANSKKKCCLPRRG